jgi:AcrR family transcriptional regulator
MIRTVVESNAVRIADRKPTRWGDREQRRLDILDAARTRIAEHGYLSLNMRDLAAAAGISPATLYSYFATKEELFATLYAQAIRAHTEAFRPVAEAGLGLEELLRHLIGAHVELYRSYGRHFTLWSALRHDAGPGGEGARVPRELVAELRAVTFEQARLQMASIRDAAARDGLAVLDDRRVPSYLWSTLNGVADHVTSERRTLDPFSDGDFVAFTATRLAAAITAPG